MKTIYTTLVLFSLTVLTGCGFHLKNDSPWSAAPQKLAIQGQRDLVLAMRGVLAQRGVALSARAPYVLNLIELENKALALTYNEGYIAQYQLIETLKWSLQCAHGKVLIKPRQTSLNRVYHALYGTLINDTEIQLVRDEMLQDISQRVFYQLQALRQNSFAQCEEEQKKDVQQ